MKNQTPSSSPCEDVVPIESFLASLSWFMREAINIIPRHKQQSVLFLILFFAISIGQNKFSVTAIGILCDLIYMEADSKLMHYERTGRKLNS